VRDVNNPGVLGVPVRSRFHPSFAASAAAGSLYTTWFSWLVGAGTLLKRAPVRVRGVHGATLLCQCGKGLGAALSTNKGLSSQAVMLPVSKPMAGGQTMQSDTSFFLQAAGMFFACGSGGQEGVQAGEGHGNIMSPPTSNAAVPPAPAIVQQCLTGRNCTLSVSH
jgi:hypothetical protein